jgi:hypothetical protein
MTHLEIQRTLSLVVAVLSAMLVGLMVGRNRQGRLVPDWLRAASKSNLLLIAFCTLGLLACALKLIPL